VGRCFFSITHKTTRNKTIEIENIPLDDPKAFELLGSGQTAGVFQVEGGGMTRWLVEMKPKTGLKSFGPFRPEPLGH